MKAVQSRLCDFLSFSLLSLQGTNKPELIFMTVIPRSTAICIHNMQFNCLSLNRG